MLTQRWLDKTKDPTAFLRDDPWLTCFVSAPTSPVFEACVCREVHETCHDKNPSQAGDNKKNGPTPKGADLKHVTVVLGN